MKRMAALVIGASLIWLSGCEPQEAVSGSIQPPALPTAPIEREHLPSGKRLVQGCPITTCSHLVGLGHVSGTHSINCSWSHTTHGNDSARS